MVDATRLGAWLRPGEGIGWLAYAKLSLSNARRLSFSGMCILLFLFLSLWRFCLFVFFFCSHWSLVDVANPARGLLNREKKKKKKKSGSAPPFPLALLVRRKNKK